MEIDAISVVTPPKPWGQEGVSTRFVERCLGQDVSQWREQVQHLLKGKGIGLHWRKYNWGDVDLQEELPTDVLAYFVHHLDPRIAPEIGELVLDGRVHFILVLSQEKFPITEDWCQNFQTLSLRARRSEGGIFVTEGLIERYGPNALIRFYELPSYTHAMVDGMLDQLVKRKENFG